MSDKIVIHTPVEIRESGRLHGLLLTEGRASSDRKELFTLNSIQWAATGIRVRAAHMQDAGSVLAYPVRTGAEIRVNVAPSVEIIEAVQSGKSYMSIEFRALEESLTESGIREIASALLVGAAVVREPSYAQTGAEIRSREAILNDNYLLYL